MAKVSTLYVCQVCATKHPKWTGKCQGCAGWNTIQEEAAEIHPKFLAKGFVASETSALSVESIGDATTTYARILSDDPEFDRVCGGGVVPGSVILLGGDPGIGKSTLLLQIAARLSNKISSLYITGEEDLNQVRMRAHRLGLSTSPLSLAATTRVQEIIAHLNAPNAPKLAIIDSIQTLYFEGLDAAPGSVTQVRACCHALVRIAKEKNISLLIISHVTKDGVIAGPKLLEHMVDTVLYFEGEKTNQYRLLRTIKNRFGASEEVGVFEMVQGGLLSIENPSHIFLSSHKATVPGAAVFAGMEGTRPLLVEIQSLISRASYAAPKRATVGWDYNRLSMILAVLESRAGLRFGDKDVYLNIAGGLKIQETASDFAVVASLVSAALQKSLPRDSIFLGEIALSGEIRPVSSIEARLKEAQKLGFKTIYLPKSGKKTPVIDGLTFSYFQFITEFINSFKKDEF